MTIIKYFVAASLDGFIADEHGKLDWLTSFDREEGVAEHVARFLDGIGALVMGAPTYEFLVKEGIPWPYGDRPCWVFTHRALPPIAGADVRLRSGPVVDHHDAILRSAGERDVWVVGGGKLAAQFAEHDLIDEIWQSVIPVVLGAGSPVLPLAARRSLRLVGVTRLGGGLVELRYDVTRPEVRG